jgi:hypothetical protein
MRVGPSVIIGFLHRAGAATLDLDDRAALAHA